MSKRPPVPFQSTSNTEQKYELLLSRIAPHKLGVIYQARDASLDKEKSYSLHQLMQRFIDIATAEPFNIPNKDKDWGFLSANLFEHIFFYFNYCEQSTVLRNINKHWRQIVNNNLLAKRHLEIIDLRAINLKANKFIENFWLTVVQLNLLNKIKKIDAGIPSLIVDACFPDDGMLVYDSKIAHQNVSTILSRAQSLSCLSSLTLTLGLIHCDLASLQFLTALTTLNLYDWTAIRNEDLSIISRLPELKHLRFLDTGSKRPTPESSWETPHIDWNLLGQLSKLVTLVVDEIYVPSSSNSKVLSMQLGIASLMIQLRCLQHFEVGGIEFDSAKLSTDQWSTALSHASFCVVAAALPKTFFSKQRLNFLELTLHDQKNLQSAEEKTPQISDPLQFLSHQKHLTHLNLMLATPYTVNNLNLASSSDFILTRDDLLTHLPVSLTHLVLGAINFSLKTWHLDRMAFYIIVKTLRQLISLQITLSNQNQNKLPEDNKLIETAQQSPLQRLQLNTPHVSDISLFRFISQLAQLKHFNQKSQSSVEVQALRETGIRVNEIRLSEIEAIRSSISPTLESLTFSQYYFSMPPFSDDDRHGILFKGCIDEEDRDLAFECKNTSERFPNLQEIYRGGVFAATALPPELREQQEAKAELIDGENSNNEFTNPLTMT